MKEENAMKAVEVEFSIMQRLLYFRGLSKTEGTVLALLQY